jgi:hypothetical protein
MATKVVCIEHGLRIGGCDCNGAIIKKKPCTGTHLEATPAPVAKPFALNPQPPIPFVQELHDLAMAEYEKRKDTI